MTARCPTLWFARKCAESGTVLAPFVVAKLVADVDEVLAENERLTAENTALMEAARL